jgi:hypothetical protein
MPELQHKLFEADDNFFASPMFDKAQSVLVIECNPDALDPLVSGTVERLEKLIPNQLHAEVISVTSSGALTQRLFQLRASGNQYGLVLLLGNLNHTHLELANGQALTWAELAYQILLPFEPEHMLLLSPLPDSEAPVHTIFEAVPMLKAIYVSPVIEARLQTDVLKFMVSYLVANSLDEADRAFSAQVAEKLFASGMVIRWTWRDSLKQRLLNIFEMLNTMEKLEVAAELTRRAAQAAPPYSQLQRKQDA